MVSWEVIYRATVFIAEEMGVALKRSALSPNIRERVDHSCAILDSDGRIIAQAEHIPVHLGSFKIGVQNTLNWLKQENIVLNDGDMIVLNDPYIAGTHLNDVMILAPIFLKDEIIGYVVNKAHQVDVGGPLPGSLNPNAKTIYEEGFIIPPTKLIKNGKIDSEIMRILINNFKTPDVSYGDLNAQIAANRTGIQRILQLTDKYGLEEIKNSWITSLHYGEELTKRELKMWPKGVYEAEDYLEWEDNFLNIKVKLKFMDHIIVDFTGTHEQVDAPLNAVLGVTYSATSFAIRSIMNRDIPTNDGFYNLIRIIAPEGTILNPRKPAAVGGGNLETSQRVADTVLLALSKALPWKIPAAGSGTMMNVMMGGMHQGKYWSYYETIGGGSGGRPNKPGVSGVHVNMTNTLNTPIEIAERYYPLLFTKYTIREGSGGEGKFKGGDGIIRAFKVLSPTRLSILSDRFKLGPWGLEGGKNGSPGKVKILSDHEKEMPSKFTVELKIGDEVIIETPGGGGYGYKDYGN
ncbi:MAG: hydantoinase B/oxoprolinase family protein [Thermoprotei archaeon]